MLVQSQKRQLDDLGYLVLPGFVPPPLLAKLLERVETLWGLEGDDAGSEFRLEPGSRRLANLVDKGAVFAELVAMPEILVHRPCHRPRLQAQQPQRTLGQSAQRRIAAFACRCRRGRR